MARAERRTLILRIVSALVLAPPALAAVWLGWPWLQLLVVLMAGGMAWEWASLASGGAGRSLAGSLIVLTSVAATVAMAFGWGAAGLLLAVFGSIAVGVAAAWDKDGAPLPAAFGTAWIAVSCVAFVWLGAGPESGRNAIFWLLLTVWATDSGAYVAGRGIGGPRLAPRLSPNKTWAGFFGGVLCAGAVGVAAELLAGGTAMIVLAGLALGVASQLGDLAESAAKRHFGVKDSGSVIPGHGGLLDRLDGLLAAASLQGVLTLAAGASPLLWRA